MRNEVSICRLVEIANDVEAEGAYSSANTIRNAALEIAMLREEMEDLRTRFDALVFETEYQHATRCRRVAGDSGEGPEPF